MFNYKECHKEWKDLVSKMLKEEIAPWVQESSSIIGQHFNVVDYENKLSLGLNKIDNIINQKYNLYGSWRTYYSFANEDSVQQLYIYCTDKAFVRDTRPDFELFLKHEKPSRFKKILAFLMTCIKYDPLTLEIVIFPWKG